MKKVKISMKCFIFIKIKCFDQPQMNFFNFVFQEILNIFVFIVFHDADSPLKCLPNSSVLEKYGFLYLDQQ